MNKYRIRELDIEFIVDSRNTMLKSIIDEKRLCLEIGEFYPFLSLSCLPPCNITFDFIVNALIVNS